MSQPLRSEDMPKPTTRAERRRWQAEDEKEAKRGAYRPNADPTRGDGFDRCLQSKYFTHRFTAEKGRCCDFCGRSLDECRLKR